MKQAKMADLKKRLFVSLILICALAFLITFSSCEWVGALLVLTVAAATAVGLWEYAQLAVAKELKIATKWLIGIGILEVIAFYLFLKNPALSLLPIGVLIAGAICFFLLHFKDPKNALSQVSVEFFGLCYIAVPLAFLLGILYPPVSSFFANYGQWWLIYLIVVTKITDVGAYFIGRLWGKRKLAPILSPKKTVEGAIAGFISATLMSLLMLILTRAFSTAALPLSLMSALFLGMLIGIFAQIGDLAESLFKRDAVVKDSNSLPGLGGVLDILDSLILTIPIIYFFLRM